MRMWGPDGGNDNFRCTIVNKVNRSMYFRSNGLGGRDKYPRFCLVQESQISKSSSTFTYGDLQKAISEGGIDCIYYLNPIFMFHSLYSIPDWLKCAFETDITRLRRWNVNPDASKIYEPLEEIGKGELELCNPIEFKLLKLNSTLKIRETALRRIDLLTNNVNECLAAIVRFGKGFIYFIPPFVDPIRGTVKLMNEILPNFKDSYNECLKKRKTLQPAQKPGEKVYEPGEQYLVYRDLKEIISGAETEVFVIDSYANEEIFDLYMDKVKGDVEIQFLTKNPSNNLVTVINKFKAKPRVKFEARKTGNIHDRVIFIDKKQCWVLGHSIKDAAINKPTYLLSVESVVDMKNMYETIWSNATPI